MGIKHEFLVNPPHPHPIIIIIRSSSKSGTEADGGSNNIYAAKLWVFLCDTFRKAGRRRERFDRSPPSGTVYMVIWKCCWLTKKRSPDSASLAEPKGFPQNRNASGKKLSVHDNGPKIYNEALSLWLYKACDLITKSDIFATLCFLR